MTPDDTHTALLTAIKNRADFKRMAGNDKAFAKCTRDLARAERHAPFEGWCSYCQLSCHCYDDAPAEIADTLYAGDCICDTNRTWPCSDYTDLMADYGVTTNG